MKCKSCSTTLLAQHRRCPHCGEVAPASRGQQLGATPAYGLGGKKTRGLHTQVSAPDAKGSGAAASKYPPELGAARNRYSSA
jgi:hypothetical protein